MFGVEDGEASESMSMAGVVVERQQRQAIRAAIASTITGALAFWFRLEIPFLGVVTCYIVSLSTTTTGFQKGIERIVGRAIGILYGLMLHQFFQVVPPVGFGLKLLGMLVMFYVHFSGRFAYTFLQAGFYLAVVVEVGYIDPLDVNGFAWSALGSMSLGIAVAISALWLEGSESSLTIVDTHTPLWPIRRDWLNHSAMLVVTVALTQMVTQFLKLPVSASLVSVLLLTTTTDERALLIKASQRLGGALAAIVYGVPSIIILSHVPTFPTLLLLLVLGMLLGASIATRSANYSYLGLQMGVVIPMILVVDRDGVGDLVAVEQRLLGIFSASLVSVSVGAAWPGFPATSISTSSQAKPSIGGTPS